MSSRPIAVISGVQIWPLSEDGSWTISSTVELVGLHALVACQGSAKRMETEGKGAHGREGCLPALEAGRSCTLQPSSAALATCPCHRPPATGHQHAELGREVQGPLIQAPAAALRDPPPTIPPCPSRGGCWPRPRNSKVAALSPAGLAGVGGVRTTRAGKDRSSSGRGTCRAPRTGVRRRPGGAIAPVPGARRSSPARPDPREARDTTGPPVKSTAGEDPWPLPSCRSWLLSFGYRPVPAQVRSCPG